MVEKIQLLYIDLFCGAGGTSTGVERATDLEGHKCAKVIACVNHDRNAIASHAANHPDALHFTEDIRTLELSPLVEHLEACRNEYPRAKVVLWASLECTNFSRAKGGLPRDADSRTLAEHLFRYIDALCPDYIQIENVEEFMSWGDLDENGHPISKDAGRLYRRWVDNVRAYGYRYEWQMMNAADFGAYTSRRRFFGMFAKGDLPIVFPEPTHSRDGRPGTKKWRAVKDVLDLRDAGQSIFDRKKPLCEKTLMRIRAGLYKFVAGGKSDFIVKWNSFSSKGKYLPPSTEDPCPTVVTQNRLGLAKVRFLSKAYSGEPAGKNIGVEGPAGTVTTTDHHQFITVYHGRSGAVSIDYPAPTLTTKDRLSMVFLDNMYGTGKPSSIERPNPTLTTNPHQQTVAVHFIENPQFKSQGASVEGPCPTVIARQDKRPLQLASVLLGGYHPSFIRETPDGLVYEVYGTDSETMRDIKLFMAQFGVCDITMRMLKVSELLRIMGFGDDYVLVGNVGERKKYIGNAVCPEVPSAWCKAIVSCFHCMGSGAGIDTNCQFLEKYSLNLAGCLKTGSLIAI